MKLPFRAVNQLGSRKWQLPIGDPVITRHARGTFLVHGKPLQSSHSAACSVGDFIHPKEFHGDLEADSRVEILNQFDLGGGGSAFIAIEHISGQLHGLRGRFALQLVGTIDNGSSELTATVQPGSSTGELVGIVGVMSFIGANRKNTYDFEYVLPNLPKRMEAG